jgi:GDPmannose 4,6-dehydratase
VAETFAGRSALITGITGQDGSYLSELLLSKGYTVHGIVRRSSTFNTSRINHLYTDPHEAERRLILHYGDLTDSTGLRRVIEAARPDEIYNLGAQSHVKVSFENPVYTADADALGTLRLLECMRDHVEHTGRNVRFYQAGSSEMFGAAKPPQREDTPFYPRSPYAVSKVASHWYAINYREAYKLFISNGILFNHESPRRGETFVTRKITRAIGRIRFGLQEKLYLGNLDSRRDWGFAGDYVEAMWRMLQHPQAGDFVIATGTAYSVKDFLEVAFSYAGLDWRECVTIDPKYFRPTEVDFLQGDSTRAREVLGWSPSTSFHQLVSMMVDADLRLAEEERVMTDVKYTNSLTMISAPHGFSPLRGDVSIKSPA